MDEREVGPVEPIDNEPDPGPDIGNSELLSGPLSERQSPQISPGEEYLKDEKSQRGTGRIFSGGDVERVQGEQLAKQIMRSTGRQLEYVSEQLSNLRWIETDGSRYVEGNDKVVVYEMEFTFANGRSIRLTGPVINVEFR